MIIKIGNIFDSGVKTLVNTVNCVGIMGKGIALDFKRKYPDMYKEYVFLCENNKVKVGEPYLYQDFSGASILNFPTKDHWKSPSKLSYIIDGLNWFIDNYNKLGIESIAFPPLGCGNGGLSWNIVGPVMYNKLKDLPIYIEIYAPYGTSVEFINEDYLRNSNYDNENDIEGAYLKKININWFLILYVIQKLNNDRYSLNVGRTIFQKICFLLTRMGINTGLEFKKSYYGPYSSDINNIINLFSNANYITEKKLGKMVETVVSEKFKLNYNNYNQEDIKKADCVYDLLSRIKSTEQAEMIATVIFAFDELHKQNNKITEQEILDYVLKWKPHWEKEKKDEIISNISGLSELKWIEPCGESLLNDDLLY